MSVAGKDAIGCRVRRMLERIIDGTDAQAARSTACIRCLVLDNVSKFVREQAQALTAG
jgi:hypothetical protein